MNDRNRPRSGVCANLFAVCTHTLESCFVGRLYVVIPELVLLTSMFNVIGNHKWSNASIWGREGSH